MSDLLGRLRVPCATADSKMAADEIERLRAVLAVERMCEIAHACATADEIERLRAVNIELLAALEDLVNHTAYEDIREFQQFWANARAAIVMAKGEE